MSRVRIIIEVNAGVLVNTAMPEYHKQFFITEEQWEDKTGLEVMKVYGFAQEYMRNLWHPQKVNWVSCSWIYL